MFFFNNIIEYLVLIKLFHTVSLDPVQDVMNFIREYEEQYSTNHPVFYQGSYSQALSDAKQELRFLVVYLHKDESQEVDEWCRYLYFTYFTV